MTSDEYRTALAELGMTQVGAARVFGINERTSRRFATGNDIPWNIEMLLNVMIAKSIPIRVIIRVPKQATMPRTIRQILHLLDKGWMTPEEAITLGLKLAC